MAVSTAASEMGKDQIDCLILEEQPDLQAIFDQLSATALLFPVIVVKAGDLTAQDWQVAELSGSDPKKSEFNPSDLSPIKSAPWRYHPAILRLGLSQLEQISERIDRAIAAYIQVSPTAHTQVANPSLGLVESMTLGQALLNQQFRLAEKLKERLGYLGVYYKRNPQQFMRHLEPHEKDELLRQLKTEYREIILLYFTDSTTLNDRMDSFVNLAFFVDLPVSQIVELHMELMDEFAKQLKLEGRSEEILLDYRLTLIDMLAHLCEMYRRSIPRES
jgi:circadian clock protein KaiA